jgi:NNP family nitrate/nitrite transporter-like MFS transporter
MWIFVLTYGFCFGVELVVDNVLHDYFYNQFNMSIKEAGLVASYSGLMNVCSRALGGVCSDLAAKRYGMRGRLWTLWFLQTLSGGVCVAFGFCSTSLADSITTMVIFSFFTQMSCGATYGIVPFISKRALGVVSGFVGAGGNTIAAIIQYVFFTHTQVWTEIAITNLGAWRRQRRCMCIDACDAACCGFVVRRC